MEYLIHPYFDDSGRTDWIEFPLDSDGKQLQHGEDKQFADVVRRDFDQVTSLVLTRLNACMPADWLCECPCPILNELLFHPTSNAGIHVFLQYMFRPSLTENSFHTDSWWAIVLCPYTSGNPYTGKNDYDIVHFGWSVD